MNQHNKLSSRQHEQQAVEHHTEEQQRAREFSTPDALLRHDAEQTPLPEGIRQRLAESARDIPRPGSWWQRLFKRS